MSHLTFCSCCVGISGREGIYYYELSLKCYLYKMEGRGKKKVKLAVNHFFFFFLIFLAAFFSY